MNLLITGTSGFVGRQLAKSAAQEGHYIYALSSSKKNHLKRGQLFLWHLGDPISSHICDDTNCAIHLAYDFTSQTSKKNIDGTVKIIKQLQEAGVSRQLFFSSLSAHSDATSVYGRAKYHIERQVADIEGVIIVRPGLIIGNGGIYGRMKKWLYNFSIIPLPDGGYNRVYIITIEDLIRQTMFLVNAKRVECEYNLFNEQPVNLRNLMEEEAERLGKSILIIPVPSKILIQILKFFEAMRFPLPVKADNLIGFIANQNRNYEASKGLYDRV